MTQVTRLSRTNTSPPRPAQLPAIRRCHMPRVSVHGAGHAPRPHEHLPTAPHTATRDTPVPHATRIGAWRRPRASTACTSPPRPTQLPAIRQRHRPHVSVHDAGHTPQPHEHLPTAPHTATRDTTRHTPCVSVHDAGHTPRPHAPHRAPHSYPRYAGATRHTYRCMAHRHTPRPHAHLPTTPHTATRDTTVPHAAHVGA